MSLVLAAVAQAAEPVPAHVYAHGSREVPAVALTFDLCPTSAPVELDERIVDALVAAEARATFFVSGRWALARPEAVRRLAGEPLFEIANHSFHHPHLTTSDDAGVREELVTTDALLEKITGHAPRWFRPPFGEVDARVARIAAEVGLGTVTFDVISGDPAPGMTAARIVRAVLSQARRGSIVIMHANHRRFPTAEAVPAIIEGLRARGFELTTVSGLLDGGTGSVERAR